MPSESKEKSIRELVQSKEDPTFCGRAVKLDAVINAGVEGVECADCHAVNGAMIRVTEPDGRVWLWCGDCWLGG
jgi:hypothetical protein